MQSPKVPLTLSVHTRHKGCLCRCLTSINTFSVQLQTSSYCLCAVKAHISAGILGHFSVELTLSISTVRGWIILEIPITTPKVCVCVCACVHACVCVCVSVCVWVCVFHCLSLGPSSTEIHCIWPRLNCCDLLNNSLQWYGYDHCPAVQYNIKWAN